MKRKTKHEWHYQPDYPLKPRLRDPRIQITKQTGWELYKSTINPGQTRWAGPEPDNYTHAIYAENKHFIEGVEHQCWYKLPYANGWFSVYITTDEVLNEYIKDKKIFAIWRCDAPKPIRTKVSRIRYEATKKWGEKNQERTADERLYDLGFVDKLIAMGVDPSFIEQTMGVPRPIQYYELNEDEKDVGT